MSSYETCSICGELYEPYTVCSECGDAISNEQIEEAVKAERERIINFLISSPDFHLCSDNGICPNGVIRKALNP